jgi:peptide/nickel transport system permease protein
MVLNLPTTGPMLFNALLTEDMFLASSLLLFLSVLTVIGTFISDILLVMLDPRIRFTARET